MGSCSAWWAPCLDLLRVDVCRFASYSSWAPSAAYICRVVRLHMRQYQQSLLRSPGSQGIKFRVMCSWQHAHSCRARSSQSHMHPQ